MPYEHPAQIEPEILHWAMGRAQVPAADLARAVGTSEAVLTTLLNGQQLPSFHQARKLADKLRIPFGVLFLTEPPVSALPVADFRTIGRGVQAPSVDLHDVLMAVMRRQDWLRDYLQATGAAPVAMVGSLPEPESDSPEALAAVLRDQLQLETLVRPSRVDAFFRELVVRAEKAGVNVAKNGVVGNNTSRPLDVAEFRGFALSDEYAPFVFINGADAPGAQLFTLMHELAHIVRGDSGISASDVADAGRIESVCNAAAAEVLVPREEFVDVWQPHAAVDTAIELAAEHFRVSQYVIAIRAFTNSLISHTELSQLLATFRSQHQNRDKGTGGGDFYTNLPVKNGRKFTSHLVDAHRRQHVLLRDAASLLDVKTRTVPKLLAVAG